MQVCILSDNRELTIGAKRNQLMDMAVGDYVAYIDDDDEIGTDYFAQVLEAIEKERPDVIGLMGIMRWMKSRTRSVNYRFFHTIQNDSWWQSKRGYERPPNHLNPIRRDIASRFRFEDISHGEDRDWSLRIADAKVLKTEVMVGVPIYYYNFNPFKNY